MDECKICSNRRDNTQHTVREMMLGTREEFSYLECSACGCLQLLNPPDDPSAFYDSDYYSFKTDTSVTQSRLKKYLKRKVLDNCIGNKNLTGLLLGSQFTPPPFAEWLKKTGIRQQHAILDVGTGSGALLTYMRGFGFNNLAGCDPFIAEDKILDDAISIRKCELNEMSGSFDLIIFNHSFEHMVDPLAILTKTRQLLINGGWALIRVPVAGSTAWEKYGSNWVQLDAPRHLWLHTERSIETLAGKVGLKLIETVYDSTIFQFWGSEQYRKDIALLADNSYLRDPDKSIFNAEKIAEYQKKAEELNENKLGDQASFYLQKSNMK